MKNLFIIILIISSHSILQAQQISNVRATQNSDNVSIGYDITGAKAGQTFDIEVKCSLNGGNSFTIFPTSISGDIKGVTNGYGKQINWDVLQDRDEIVGENIVFEVTATVKGGETDFSAMQGTFTDSLDNHIYKWVKIGKQIWMAENLAYKPISGNYWAYDNKQNNISKYGYLYDWEAAKRACPNGWHLPSDEEWTTLTDYLGGENIAGGKLKSTGSWSSQNTVANNASGFSALPAGKRYSDGLFYFVGKLGYFWSSTPKTEENAWVRRLDYDNNRVSCDSGNRACGFSIRCLKN